MQKISELLNIEITLENPLTIYHPIFENKEIYYENSNGYWEKREYDSNNKEIYIENSNGDWIKAEYDDNNNQIYFENNTGKIIDDRKQTELTLDQIADKFNISVNQLKIKK